MKPPPGSLEHHRQELKKAVEDLRWALIEKMLKDLTEANRKKNSFVDWLKAFRVGWLWKK